VALDRDDEATVESLFQAGSASKPVAALVTSALVRKGALALERRAESPVILSSCPGPGGKS